MEKYSLKNNRISAFIFIENKFYCHKLHTECVTEYLKHKNLIKTDNELYKLLKNKKTEQMAREWIQLIEENCIFGETAIMDGSLVVIIYENLTQKGIEIIKSKSKERFGTDKVYIAMYTGNKNAKFNYILV